MTYSFTKALEKIDLEIYEAKRSRVNLGLEYIDACSTGFCLQKNIRDASYDLYKISVGLFELLEGYVDPIVYREALVSMSKARNIFGNHSFSHVLEGRLKHMFVVAIENNLDVSAEFDYLLDIKSMPWNNPELDYNTLWDFESLFEIGLIPPDWVSNSTFYGSNMTWS